MAIAPQRQSHLEKKKKKDEALQETVFPLLKYKQNSNTNNIYKRHFETSQNLNYLHTEIQVIICLYNTVLP